MKGRKSKFLSNFYNNFKFHSYIKISIIKGKKYNQDYSFRLTKYNIYSSNKPYPDRINVLITLKLFPNTKYHIVCSITIINYKYKNFTANKTSLE